MSDMKRRPAKKRSATKRYQEIAHHYQNNVVGGRPFTTDEVTCWIFKHNLFPVASIRDSDEYAADWERRFAEARKAQ